MRLIRNVRNDGTFPGMDVGKLLVRRGSVGYVRDVGTFLQDQLIYSVEKALSDLGEKADSAKRSDIEDRIRRLREKLDANAEIAELRRETEELAKASQEIAAEAYKESSGAAEGPPGEEAGGATSEADEDEGEYIDAEYEEEQ